MSAASFSAYQTATSEVAALTTDVLLDGFSASLPVEVSGATRFEDEVIAPIGGVANDVVSFYVPASSMASGGFVDLSESYVRLRLAIGMLDEAGAPIPGGYGDATSQAVVPEVDFLSMLWTRVSTVVAGVEMGNDSAGLEMIASHIYKLLTKSHGAAGSRYHCSAGSDPLGLILDIGATTDASEKQGWSEVFNLPGIGGNNHKVGARATADQAAGWFRYRINADAASGVPSRAPYVELLYRPSGGIWSTGHFDADGVLKGSFLPPNVDMTVTLTKNHVDAPWCSATNPTQGVEVPNRYPGRRAYIDWGTSAADLVLRRVFPTAALAERVASSAFSSSTLYPFQRMRVASQQFAYGTTSVSMAPLLPGAKGSVMVIAVLDANSISKPTNSAGAGGQQYRTLMMSGAAQDYLDNTDELAGTPAALTARTRSYPPRVTSAQLSFNSRSMPRRPFSAPSEMDSAELYKAYARCCINQAQPCISESEWKYGASLICFDLTDSASAGEAMAGRTTEAPSADSGAFTLDLQLAPCQHNIGTRSSARGQEGQAADQHPFVVVACLIGTAYAAISASTSTASRIGF